MCDVKKYSDIYKEIAKLNPKDTLQLVLESETEEEKDFYEMVGDFLLQRRQKEVVDRPIGETLDENGFSIIGITDFLIRYIK